MTTQTENTYITDMKILRTPDETKYLCPTTESHRFRISQYRESMIRILQNKDKRFIIQVGPCSIHNVTDALEYAHKLKSIAQAVESKIMVMMRVYFEKPRTTIGWKGLIAEPYIDGKQDFDKGLYLARQLLLDISNIGLPTVTEFLDPLVPQYIADLITTGTIGARTVESQIHRQMASGLSMPIGFKNGTGGDITHALDALVAGRSKGSFLGINRFGSVSMITTSGNPNGYLILRGGNSKPNFDEASIAAAIETMQKRNTNSRIVVDCSHSNSGKLHENQQVVFESVIQQVLNGNRNIAGLMLESNLESGKQDANSRPLKKGVSITDACIGWKETEELILRAFEVL